MDAADTDELARLRRQLRAQSAVNRQLHAQIEGGSLRVASGRGGADGARTALTVRRVAEGGAWLEHLHMHGGGDPVLVRTPAKLMFVIEGDMRRPVKAGIIFTALTRVLGEPREVTDADLKRYSSGPPVEVLESGTGSGVRGGRRAPPAAARAAAPLPRVHRRHAAVPRGPGAQRRERRGRHPRAGARA